MVFHTFQELMDKVKTQSSPARMAVAAAEDTHTLEAVLQAQDAGMIIPVLTGQVDVIRQLLHELGRQLPETSLYQADTPEEAARLAVRLVKEGTADFLMKGKLDTAVLLKAVVDKESGMGRGRTMSHFAMFEVPGYHKLMVPVDGGMITYPTLEQKQDIINNSVEILHALGYTCPKVGVLACVEKVNPKMPETMEARELEERNRRGEITGCIVSGPISYDCAVDAEIARVKGYESPVAGDVDILVAPNIHAGNIMGKMLLCTCHAKMAGFIAGAACPIVLTSRGSSAEEKFLSIVLSSAAAKNMGSTP